MSGPRDDLPRVNVADRLAAVALQRPDDLALVCAKGRRYESVTYAQLDQDATLLAQGLVARGVEPGLRMALLVKPGIEFVTLVFALLRTGATMVLVDSGLGVKNIVRCLESTKPDGFVGISQAQTLRQLFFWKFWDAKINVTVGRKRWPLISEHTLESTRDWAKRFSPELPDTTADDPAAIVFTSGSTGPPKGVLYRHETFVTQADEIQRQYDLRPGGVDLACFPLFGLFNVACGVTTVLPEMDFSRPASCDPEKLFRAANDWKVNQAFASPAVWDRLSRHAETSGDKIPTLRKVFSCGAPVPAEVIRRTLTMVAPDAQLHTPYGATESLPVATIEAQEILNETAEQTAQGAGVCVGRKFDSIDWRVIKITDAPIPTIDQTKELPVGEIGELIVRGPQVSREYLIADYGLRNADSVDHNGIAKIIDSDSIWHRMGDVGYFDEQGRFWYCGRKSQRVVASEGTLYTECVEQRVNCENDIKRTALVGVRQDQTTVPVLICEDYHPWEGDPKAREQAEFAIESLGLSKQVTHILWHSSLPTDIRHNSKINREKLAAWAAEKLK